MTSSRRFFRAYRLSLLATLVASQSFLSACSATGAKASAQETKPAAVAAATTSPEPATENKHTVKRGETTLALARTYLSQSSLMTVAELDAAIRDANHLNKGAALKPGAEIVIPTLEKQPVVEKTRPLPTD